MFKIPKRLTGVFGILLIFALELNIATQYFVIDVNVDYDAAIQLCLDNNATLATITNENEFNMVRELCRGNNESCWIGLNKRINGIHWRYIDGTSVKNTFGFDSNGNVINGSAWDYGEPILDDNRDCVYYYKSDDNNGFMWRTDICSNEYNPVCMHIETTPITQLCINLYMYEYVVDILKISDFLLFQFLLIIMTLYNNVINLVVY